MPGAPARTFKFVLRYAIETVNGVIYKDSSPHNPTIDFFILKENQITTDRDQAMKFDSDGEAKEYAANYSYPYPLKTELVESD